MEPLVHAASVVVAAPADALYDMVADVTRMGEWSPVCRACWWDEGAGPRVGALFTGRNQLADRTWETRCEVVAAERPRHFAFVVQATGVRWGYTFSPLDGGTEVTETWTFPEMAVENFRRRFGDDADAQQANRLDLARTGIPATLDAIKRAAEAGAA